MTTLQKARKASDYTRKELAKAVGISPDTLKNYELGKRLPTVKVGYLLQQALDTPIEKLFDLDNTTER